MSTRLPTLQEADRLRPNTSPEPFARHRAPIGIRRLVLEQDPARIHAAAFEVPGALPRVQHFGRAKPHPGPGRLPLGLLDVGQAGVVALQRRCSASSRDWPMRKGSARRNRMSVARTCSGSPRLCRLTTRRKNRSRGVADIVYRGKAGCNDARCSKSTGIEPPQRNFR